MKKLMIGIFFAFAIIFSTATYAAAPLITNSTPADGAYAIKTNSNVTVTVNDTDGNLMNITFSMWNGTAWRVMSTFTNRPNGRYIGNGNGFFTQPYTEYMWRAIVTDSTGESTTLISNFTTGDLLKQKWVTDFSSLTSGEQLWPAIGDVDNDGTIEIVIVTREGVISINGKTGQIEWIVPGGYENAVELVDLNKDGTPEILAGIGAGIRVRAFNGDGSIRWTSPYLKGEAFPMFPLLAYDTDGDGYPTIYVATQDSHPDPYSGNISDYNGALIMMDHNGNILRDTWLQKPCWGGLAISDTNYDGKFEVYVSERRDGYHNIPANGLQAFDAETLETIWARPDLQHSSPFPIIADVYEGGDLEIVAQQITLSGPLVLNATDGSNIKDYRNKGLPTHAAATVYDIDRDGNLEIMMGTSYPDSAPMDFAVFDLITGQTDFRPTFAYHMTWGPNVGSVTPDGDMQILSSMGNQGWTSTYPLLVYDSNYNLIDTVTPTGLGQLMPVKVYDIDGDGLNEVVLVGIRGRIVAYDTLAPTKYPQPRAGVQLYSEHRLGVAEFVDYPGPLAPFVKSTNPADNTTNVSANPVLTIAVHDFQFNKFDVDFEIYQGFQWRKLSTYNNVTNGNFSTNTSPYANNPSTEYQWRVILTDEHGNSKTYYYAFTTTDNINTTKPIVNNVFPLNHQTAVLLNSTELIFNISDTDLMTYNITTIPDIGSAYVTGVASGEYSLPIAGLVNNMDYIWRIEVSDGTDITYKEYYFQTPWTLTTSVIGSGAINTDPAAPFSQGAEVNLTAIPNPGNTFLGWIGDYVSYNNPLTIVLDNPKTVTARFRTESGTAIADGTFDDSLSQQELVDNAPYQDWYESRNNAEYRYLLTLDENNVGGNSGKKAKLNGSLSGNAYLTQDFKMPFNETFKLQWDVYVDSILNSSNYPDRAAIMMVGDNTPYSSRGPNYQAIRNFVWLGFYKDGGAETGTADLVTALNNASEIVLASDVPLDTWHTIRVEGNLVTDTYDVYLNDVLVGAGISARTNKTNVTHISFAQWNDGAGTFYIDNVMEVTGPIVCVDEDSDGYNVTGFTCGPVDCNDADPSINPGATELCDGIDNNCVGGIDEELTTTYYADADSDLFGNPLVSQNACSMPSGYVADNNDCDDTNAGVNPSATEVCNDIDDNCDGNIDEGDVCGGGAGTLDGWAYRKMITIDQASEDLNDFPVLIKLNDADLLKAQADGDDIAFTTSDGVTKLSHEIESYDSGKLVAWVKTDLSSTSNTEIYMYYGNPAATNQEDTENVWDNNYLAVHHLEEKIGDAIDSTSNDNDGTADNGIDQDASGFIDNGYALDGVNDKVTMPKVFTSESQFTIEAWVNTANKQGYVISQRDGSGNGAFMQYYPPEGNFQLYVNNIAIKAPASVNDWHYVVGTYDGTTARLYVDAGTPASGTATLTWPDLQTLIGDRSTGSRSYLGSVDEIRLSDVARSYAYIQTSFNNQNNPEAFYTKSVEEQLIACSDGETQQCGTTDVGECSYGIRTCSAGVWGACVGNAEPTAETCDGLDNNCDGNIDEGLTTTYYEDSDVDTFGNPLSFVDECSMPTGYVIDNTDCNDANASINPSASEVCDNGVDDNCEGNIDEGCGGYPAWDHRKTITVAKENVASDISEFPLLVSIDDSDLAVSAQADGDDIFFTAADGLTKLSHEIESYDSGKLVAWVKTDLSSSVDTVIYMYYGNPSATNQENAEDVWDSNYLTVQHLSGNDAIDSNGNNDGALLNGVSTGVAAKIGDGFSFDGTDDRVTMSQLFSGQNQFTFEAWVNTASKQGYVISQRDGSGNGAFMQYYPPEGNFQLYVNSLSIKAPASVNDWHYVVGTYDGTTAKLYVDAETPVSGDTGLIWPSLGTLIGDRTALGRAFQGSVDEIRISEVARSDAYISASYDNQNNPSAFYSIGVQE